MNKYWRMRARSGLSVREMAARSGGLIDGPTISKIETGKVKPTGGVLKAYYIVCKGLDCETYRLENTDVATGKSAVKRILQTGRRTHEELEVMLDVEFRNVHSYIRALREDDICVINLQDGGGYFIPSKSSGADIEAAKRYLAQEASREHNTHLAVAVAENFLSEAGA